MTQGWILVVCALLTGAAHGEKLIDTVQLHPESRTAAERGTEIQCLIVESTDEFKVVDVSTFPGIRQLVKIPKNEVASFTRGDHGANQWKLLHDSVAESESSHTAEEYSEKISLVEKFLKDHPSTNTADTARAALGRMKIERALVGEGWRKFNARWLEPETAQAIEDEIRLVEVTEFIQTTSGRLQDEPTLVNSINRNLDEYASSRYYPYLLEASRLLLANERRVLSEDLRQKFRHNTGNMMQIVALVDRTEKELRELGPVTLTTAPLYLQSLDAFVSSANTWPGLGHMKIVTELYMDTWLDSIWLLMLEGYGSRKLYPPRAPQWQTR